MKIRTAYGQVIHEARSRKGLTLRQAAAQASMSAGYLHEIEQGKKEASSEYLGSILLVLDVPPVRFFTEVANVYQRGQDAAHHGLNSDESLCA